MATKYDYPAKVPAKNLVVRIILILLLIVVTALFLLNLIAAPVFLCRERVHPMCGNGTGDLWKVPIYRSLPMIGYYLVYLVTLIIMLWGIAKVGRCMKCGLFALLAIPFFICAIAYLGPEISALVE